MSPRLRACLVALRIDGPCSIADVAKRTGRNRETVYGAVYELRQRNLAVRCGRASYDVTRRGRRVLAPVTTRRQRGLFEMQGEDNAVD